MLGASTILQGVVNKMVLSADIIFYHWMLRFKRVLLCIHVILFLLF